MNDDTALNIAVTCVMSSELDSETKQMIIGILREKMTSNDELQFIYRDIEEVYNSKHKRNAIGYEQGYLDGLETALNIIGEVLEETN